MSELKVYHCNEWHNEYTEFYRKDEVKKVIKKLEESHKKEVGQLLMEIAELKAQKAQAEDECAYWKMCHGNAEKARGSMKKNPSKNPTFFVIYNDFGRGIKFENIFEFAQFEALLKELKKLKKKLDGVYGKDDAKYLKLVSKMVWDENKNRMKYTPEDLIEMELRHKCMYYFWSKCEYEVIVTGWPDTKTERKIDIYQQLEANWETFKKMVFDVIG